LIDRKDVPHVVKKCPACGRTMYLHEPNKDGGLTVKDGEQFVIPSGWLSFSANPLKGKGHLTRYGLEWFAQMIFLDDLPKKQDDIQAEIEKNESYSTFILQKSPLLNGLDPENENHSEEIIQTLSENKSTPEWWALLLNIFSGFALDAIKEGDSQKAAWAMGCAERSRSMLVFKESLEEVVWMGHSARKIVDLLNIWDTNKENTDEEFWQRILNENSYVLSQIFSVPVVFIKDKAYVGGMNIDHKQAKFVDYIYSGESSGDTILIEIKNPKTKLIGSKYRGVYKPSSEISGAVIQVQEYKIELSKNIENITKSTAHNLSIFNPKCILIAGNGDEEIKDEKKRKSFEIFRSGLTNVEIITFDELFRKAEILASLFGLIRTEKRNKPNKLINRTENASVQIGKKPN